MAGSPFNQQNAGLALGAGGLMGGLAGLFGMGNQNPADAANKYLNQIPGQMGQYYNPYINAGKGAMSALQGQYGQLMNDPGGKLNQIGSGYQQSPGFQFALQQALQGGNHAAAAGGMAGSPQHEQQNMTMATNLGNQDYYNWLGQATGMYNQGLQGEQGINQMGFNASSGMADQMAQMLAQQGAYGYQGQAGQNQGFGQNMGNMIGSGAMLAGFM